MKSFIKLSVIAFFAMMFTIVASAASTGSCQSKAASLSLGKTVSGSLVDEYDLDYGENTGYAVYYFKLKVNRGDSATLVMSGESPYIADVYEDGIYEGESESSPPWWEEASNPYAAESRWILRSGDWDEDSPKSVDYYVVISGEDIGQSFSLQAMSGEMDPVLPQGIDADTAVLITPKETFASVTKTLSEAHGSGYYFKAQLTAGQKYYLGTYDNTTNTTDILISGFDDMSLEPVMTPVSDTIGGTQIAGGTHAGYCVIPSKTATYIIFVSNESSGQNLPITLHHKVVGARQAKDHPLAATLGAVGVAGASASISPAYRNNPESGFFDGVIDDALVSMTLEKGKKYLFFVDSLSSDPGNLLLELYDAKGNVLATSRKGFLGDGTVGPMFVYEATAAGTYYVGVCQDTADSKGDESPVAGLTGRISVSQIVEDPFLDEYDLEGTDPNAEVTPVVPAIGEYGEAPEAYDAEGQVHSFGLTDWTDTFSLPVRKGITYSFSVTPGTGTFTNGDEVVEVSGAGFAYAGTIYTLSGKTKNVLRRVSDMSAEVLSIQAGDNTMYYLDVTKDGQGVPAVYALHAMASAPDGLGYLTVNIHGPTAEAGAGWYLKGDSASLKNASGTTMLLPAGAVTVRFTAVTGFSTPADKPGTVYRDATATLDGYYNDTSDPLDDSPDTKQKEPTTNKAYAPTKLTPSAKGVTALRSLWCEDGADWYTFAGAAGTNYKFLLSDVEGDPEVRVYGPNGWTEECEYSILTNVSEAVQVVAEKGTYYVKVAHADAGDPADSAYTLTAVSAVPGVVKLAKTAISVKDSAGYADVSVSRTGKDGVMRVRYRTEGAQTDKDDAYYYPTDGILEWAAGDNKAKTVRVKLVPFGGWGTNKTVKVVFSAIPADDESFDRENEYVASFEKDKKTGLTLDTATITIAAADKKAPGTIQAVGADSKKPVFSVTAGETVVIPLERVLGADGAVGVKVEAVKGTANKSGETDFEPVATNLVWNEGETAARTVSVATKAVPGDYTAVKTFTLKLTALASAKSDPVQLEKPKLAATAVTVNILNEKFAEAFDTHAKTVTAAASGYTVKEGKKGQWVVLSDGSYSAPNGGDLTFTFATTGTFTYTVDGEKKTFTATAKDKTLKITGATTFSVDGYALDGDPVALRQGVKYAASLGSVGTVKATGKVPDGLKLAQDKNTKEWTVAGTPSKAGIYQVTYTTTIDKNTPAEVTSFCYTVEAEGTAAGTFNGLVTTVDTTNGVPTLASVTITAAVGGKLSASVNIAGKKYAFADTGYESVDVDTSNPGAPVTNLTAALPLVQKIGTGKTASTVTNWLYYTVADVPETDPSGWLAVGDVEIQMAALPDAKGSGFQEDITYTGSVCRDNSKSGKDGKAAWEAAMAAHAGYYTVSLVAPTAMLGEPSGSGYITMTLDAKGKAKIAGKLADGTAYSGSATAALDGDPESPSVRVPLFAQKGSWVFGGWLSVKVGDDGVPVVEADSIVWTNDDPASTRGGEDGFALELQPVGGWYDTVSNLQRSYLDSDLSIDLPEGDDALDEIMEALALGESYAFKAQPSGQAVDLLGNTLSVEKQSLAKDAKTKLVDWDSSANAANVKLTFKRATGIVSGTFDLWYEGINAKGATEQKAVSGLKHEGVLVLSRGDDGAFLDEEVLSSGFFLAPQNIKYIDAKGKEQKRKWTGSYRFDIKAIPADRTWTDADPGI